MPFRKIVNKIRKELKALQGEESKDTIYSSQNSFPDEDAAKAAFRKAMDKLFIIHRWNELPGLKSKFSIYNKNREAAVELGDRIKIELPGPVPENWVEVTHKEIREDVAEFTVKPCKAPEPEKEGEETVEHFFVEGASNTFKVERKGKVIIAQEIGRNEVINNQGEKAGNRGLVNTVIAEGGWMFFQKLQWEKLTKYLVHQLDEA